MKNVLIIEYRYSVLIKNLPNNFKKDKVKQIAQRVLRNNVLYSYLMTSCDYIVNPIIYNDTDYKYYKDCKKAVELENISFIVDYKNILCDERFKYIFE